MISKLIRAFFRLGVNTTNFTGDVYQVPAGIVADNSAMLGLIGGLFNVNEAEDADIFCLVGGASTALTLTGTQFANQVIDYSGSAGSGVAVTTPTAAQIIAAFPSTIPATGYNIKWWFLNDSSGQTVTLTAGSGVTIVGTATIATATTRMFIVNINRGAGTVTLINVGSMSL